MLYNISPPPRSFMPAEQSKRSFTYKMIEIDTVGGHRLKRR